jgi:hypothetical protein
MGRSVAAEAGGFMQGQAQWPAGNSAHYMGTGGATRLGRRRANFFLEEIG